MLIIQYLTAGVNTDTKRKSLAIICFGYDHGKAVNNTNPLKGHYNRIYSLAHVEEF